MSGETDSKWPAMLSDQSARFTAGWLRPPCLRRSLPYKTLQTLRQRRSAALLPIARRRFGRHGSFAPPPKTNAASRQSHFYPPDGRIVGRLIERHVVRGHRPVFGTPDDDGRAGVPAEDYQCIG
jgi:hypothetical protein